jgi:hypothetical protein
MISVGVVLDIVVGVEVMEELVKEKENEKDTEKGTERETERSRRYMWRMLGMYGWRQVCEVLKSIVRLQSISRNLELHRHIKTTE